METTGKIQRRYFVQGKSIKEIARKLRVSRNTVRRVIREEQPRPKLGRFVPMLEAWLEAEAQLPARERRTARGSAG